MLNTLWIGLNLALLYGVVAVGYTIVFGTLRMIFFAQGDLSMLAAFAAVAVLGVLPAGTPLPLVFMAMLISSAIASCCAGLLAERLALRPLVGAERVLPLISSLGVSTVFENGMRLSVGPNRIPFCFPVDLGTSSLWGVRFIGVHIVLLVTACAWLGLLDVFLRRTNWGLAIRCLAQDKEGSRLMGINTEKTVVLAFVASSICAAIGGLCMSIRSGVVSWDMGFVLGIKGFCIAILGGAGNLRGALVAALMLGVFEALFARYISSDYKDIAAFSVLVCTMVIRREGLLGEGK